jgi:hypothetical protein
VCLLQLRGEGVYDIHLFPAQPLLYALLLVCATRLAAPACLPTHPLRGNHTSPGSQCRAGLAQSCLPACTELHTAVRCSLSSATTSLQRTKSHQCKTQQKASSYHTILFEDSRLYVPLFVGQPLCSRNYCLSFVSAKTNSQWADSSCRQVDGEVGRQRQLTFVRERIEALVTSVRPMAELKGLKRDHFSGL